MGRGVAPDVASLRHYGGCALAWVLLEDATTSSVLAGCSNKRRQTASSLHPAKTSYVSQPMGVMTLPEHSLAVVLVVVVAVAFVDVIGPGDARHRAKYATDRCPMPRAESGALPAGDRRQC